MTRAPPTLAETLETTPTSTVPSADRLFDFLCWLRDCGYTLDPCQMAAAERLRLEAWTHGAESPLARRLKYRLAPIIATTPSQQAEFYRHFDTWLGTVATEPAVPRPVDPPAGPATEITRRDPRRWVAGVAVFTLLAVAAAGAWWAWPTVQTDVPSPDGNGGAPPAPRPQEPVANLPRDLPRETIEITRSVPSPYDAALRAGLTALPGLAFLAYLVTRWRRRRLWLTRRPLDIDDALTALPLPVGSVEALFTRAAFRQVARDLRHHRWRPTPELDAGRTIAATARQAGLLTLVYRERRQSPEYVFLIERSGWNDHLAQLFELAVARLRAEHVAIACLFFHTDPRVLQPADGGSTTTLVDVAAAKDDHRLIVIGTADGFFHPLRGDVEPWVQRTEPWESRTLMTARPLDQWGLAELSLLEQGFSLATVDAGGFAAAGRKLAHGDERAEVLRSRPPAGRRARTVKPPVEVLHGTWPQARCVFRDWGPDGRTDPTLPEMVVIPAGRFTMGSPPDEPERWNDEGPQHEVTIAKPFALGRTAVTQAEWRAVLGNNPSHFKGDRNPVEQVSWHNAKAFIRTLNAKLGLSERTGYRLPSEAEWEYACRAGTTTPFWWGDTITPDQANHDGNAAYNGGKTGVSRRKTVPVDEFEPNPRGLFQVHGNVWEWCEDCWNDNYDSAPTDGTAWTSGECSRRVLRGGSWSNAPWYVRSACRDRDTADVRNSNGGFRLARTFPLDY